MEGDEKLGLRETSYELSVAGGSHMLNDFVSDIESALVLCVVGWRYIGEYIIDGHWAVHVGEAFEGH